MREEFVSRRELPDAGIALLWSAETSFRVHGVFLWKHGTEEPERLAGLKEGTCPEAENLLVLLERYVSGEEIDLPLGSLALEDLPPFMRKALLLLAKKVPRGSVISYGELARMSGSPRGARAIGQAMARNPFPLFLPCHRVLPSDGSLGSYGPGPELKRLLLGREGAWHGVCDISSLPKQKKDGH